jgi:hypothetical protein
MHTSVPSVLSRSRLRFQAIKEGGDRHLTQSHVEVEERPQMNVERVVVKEERCSPLILRARLAVALTSVGE